MDWQTLRDSFDHRLIPAIVSDLWDGDPDSIQLIRQDYNIVNRFEAVGTGYYLRICHSVLHPDNQPDAAMDFLRYLVKNDVPVGQPVPSINGNYIERLADGFYVSAQVEAPGEEIGLVHTGLSTYEAWGRSLGQMHAVSRNYQLSSTIDFEFPTIQHFWKNVAPYVKRVAPEVQAAYAELTAYMNTLPKQDYGLIHGDYRPGNVIWDGTTARAIDFDEPNYHWYIADIARALLEFYDRPLAQRRAFRQAFMCGYQSEHAIDPFWVTQLPQFGQHRGMLMFLWDVEENGICPNPDLTWVLNQYDW